MAAHAASVIGRLEAKCLRLGSIDHLIDVDTHTDAELFQFVHQRDVYAPINVLQQLRHLCGGGAAYRDDMPKYGGKKHPREMDGNSTAAADHFRDISPRNGVVSRIFALRRKSYVHSFFAGA